MKHVNLLVIGGSAGGILSANTARKVYKDKSIMIIRDKKTVMVPCGIPYIYGTLFDTSKNVIPDKVVTDNQIELLIDRVISINKEEKSVITEKNDKIFYDKLVIATGSLPATPNFPGYDLSNVFEVYKDETYLINILNSVKDVKDMVVIGGGFIGVEFSEQLQKSGKNITLIQRGDKCLRRNFDHEFCDEVEALLKNNGVVIKTNSKVKEFIGNTKVNSIVLE
ncbi:MAG: FAD/NAD(P)-binding oxidoreductase, partial [Proteocatella sp.]